MAKVLNVNYTDTPISGATAVSLQLPTLNYHADYRVVQDEPNEVIITNLTSPIDQPERIRWACSEVKDIYRNSGIDPTLYYPTRRGTQILAQITDIFSITDNDVPDYLALLPISAHLVIRVPNNDLISEAVVTAETSRMIATLYETAGTTVLPRVRSLLRGALMPAAL